MGLLATELESVESRYMYSDDRYFHVQLLLLLGKLLYTF